MIKVVAFDLDDTLWAVNPVILRAERKLDAWLAARVPGLRYDVKQMREFHHELLESCPALHHRLTEFRRRLIELAMVKSKIPPSVAADHAAGAMEVFLAARNQVEFFDGAMAAIAKISPRYHLGALTNGNADITRLGLSDHFSFAFSAEQVGAPKPAPDLFHAALGHTGCAPEEMVYVGDDPIKDIDAANRLGLRTVWVRNAARQGPGETSPDIVIDSLHGLPRAIATLEAQQVRETCPGSR